MNTPDTTPKKKRVTWAFGVALFVMTVIGLSSAIYKVRRSKFPFYPTIDQVAEMGVAKVTSLTGSVTFKSISHEGQKELQPGTNLQLGDHVDVGNDSFLKLDSASGWEVALDGEGEFILEEARRKEDLSVRTFLWFMDEGVFRARYLSERSPQTKEAWLQLRFPGGRIVSLGGEILVRIPRAGGGRLQVIQGFADVFWEDGRTKRVTANEMEYL